MTSEVLIFWAAIIIACLVAIGHRPLGRLKAINRKYHILGVDHTFASAGKDDDDCDDYE